MFPSTRGSCRAGHRCSFSIVDLCYLGFFTVTLVIFLLFMYPDMGHPVLVHDRLK